MQNSIKLLQNILVIGFVLGIVTVVVGFMDMKKMNTTEGFVGSPSYPSVHNSLLLDSIYERKPVGNVTFKEQTKKVPKSYVRSFKQYTNNVQRKSPCGGKDYNPEMCPYGDEKNVKQKEKMCIPAIQEGRIGWFVAKTL